MAQTIRLPWPENLLARMEPQPDGCIYFVNGHIRTDGYGELVYPGGNMAHRAAYEHFVGPIPEGMTVGHKCHDSARCNRKTRCLHRRCVNPEHLALETMKDNTLASPNTVNSINAAKTHCIHGHEFTPENTYRRPNGVGGRSCRECRRLREVDRAAQGRRP